MKGLNVFLWIGTPGLFVLVVFFVWTARHQSDPVSARSLHSVVAVQSPVLIPYGPVPAALYYGVRTGVAFWLQMLGCRWLGLPDK